MPVMPVMPVSRGCHRNPSHTLFFTCGKRCLMPPKCHRITEPLGNATVFSHTLSFFLLLSCRWCQLCVSLQFVFCSGRSPTVDPFRCCSFIYVLISAPRAEVLVLAVRVSLLVLVWRAVCCCRTAICCLPFFMLLFTVFALHCFAASVWHQLLTWKGTKGDEDPAFYLRARPPALSVPPPSAMSVCLPLCGLSASEHKRVSFSFFINPARVSISCLGEFVPKYPLVRLLLFSS